MLLSFEASRLNTPPRNVFTLNRTLLIGCVLQLFFAIASIDAQENSDKTEDIIRVRTDLVMVPAIVTDSHGQRVAGLTQQDFSVSSDDRLVKLEFFSSGTDRVALAFMLDASGSASGYVLQEREAALSLYSRFGPGSQVAVLSFSDKLKIVAPFTSNIDQARSAFQLHLVSNQRTAIFDSAMMALTLFNERKTGPTERRIIILISDGLDTVSTSKAVDVIQRAESDGVSFYVIHFPIFSPRDGHLAPRPTAKGFRELAQKTGGRYFMVGDASNALRPEVSYNLARVFKAIEEDLTGQYLLGFYPDEASRDGNLHQVVVAINKSKSGYRVSTLREKYRLNK